MKTYVLYHANCTDGFGAAWVASLALGRSPDLLTYVPVNYGNPPPEMEPGAVLYLLDFSCRRQTLLELAGRHPVLYVIDHHKTAQADLADLPFAHFDLEHSGAVLAWKHFFGGTPVPQLLQYVEDRDLWRWQLPHSREVSAALRSYPMDFETWDLLWRRPVESLIPEGQAILRFSNLTVQAVCQQARLMDLAGYQVPAVNATCLQSEVGEELLLQFLSAPFAAVYRELKDGRRQWSLRSRGDFDVSEVARKYGGGGHKAAAGFTEEARA